MEITAKMVKQLREMTGAGVMACKNALVETDGDYDAAIDVLRKKGQASAAKKASRIAAEGLVYTEVQDGKNAVIVEVNSETDFVAKNEKFQNFVKEVAAQVMATDAADAEALLQTKLVSDPSKTMQDELVNQVATIGENMKIRRFAKITSDGIVVDYIHGGGRIGVLIEAQADDTEANREALKNVAMQIAAMNPQYIARTDMTADELAKLRDITVESSLNTPESLPKPILNSLITKALDGVWSAEDCAIYQEQKNNMQYLFNFLSKEARTQVAEIALADKEAISKEKMFSGAVEGRVAKQLKEICLMDQVYVKAEDGKQSVANYLASVDKNLKVTRMVRFEVGEGLEKKQEDFAAEVAKQMGM